MAIIQNKKKEDSNAGAGMLMVLLLLKAIFGIAPANSGIVMTSVRYQINYYRPETNTLLA